MRSTLNSSTKAVDPSTIMNRTLANRTRGPITSCLGYPSIRFQVGAANTSSSRSGHVSETNDSRSRPASESASGMGSRPSVWKEEWTPATELISTWPLSSFTVRIVPGEIRLWSRVAQR